MVYLLNVYILWHTCHWSFLCLSNVRSGDRKRVKTEGGKARIKEEGRSIAELAAEQGKSVE